MILDVAPIASVRSAPIWFFLAVLLALYLTPSLIALLRRARHALAIVALNLLLGWTGLGWIGAFVWSLISPPRPPRPL